MHELSVRGRGGSALRGGGTRVLGVRRPRRGSLVTVLVVSVLVDAHVEDGRARGR